MSNNILSILIQQRELFSALIGAILGGLLSLTGTLLAHWLNCRSKVKTDLEKVRAALLAIKVEITCIHQIYTETAGYELAKTPDGTPFLFYYPAAQDYFTVFTNNTTLVGQISDMDLREKLINAYTKAKALLDSYKMNNYMLEKWEFFNALFEETNSPSHKKLADSWLKGMIEYSNSLRTMNNAFIEAKNELVIKIDSYLSI